MDETMLKAVEVLVCLALCSTVVKGSPPCVPKEIVLQPRNVMMTSTDNAYKAGDIFYRNCSVPSKRPFIGWYPDISDKSPRLQVNLRKVTDIRAIVIQTTVTDCANPNHDYTFNGYTTSFDLKYVQAGDDDRKLIPYAENLPALTAHTAERVVRFDKPLVTSTLQIIPRSTNMYHCFRFKLLGCETGGPYAPSTTATTPTTTDTASTTPKPTTTTTTTTMPPVTATTMPPVTATSPTLSTKAPPTTKTSTNPSLHASTTQCHDHSGCAQLLSTGYDVCTSAQVAVSLCKKTCHIC